MKKMTNKSSMNQFMHIYTNSKLLVNLDKNAKIYIPLQHGHYKTLTRINITSCSFHCVLSVRTPGCSGI